MTQPNRAFLSQLGLASGALVLLCAAALRYLRAGLPAGSSWRYALLPGATDLAIHLISSALLLLLAAGLLRSVRMLVWHYAHMLRFVARCQIANEIGAEPGAQALARVTSRVGLTGHLTLLRSSSPLAFCFGLIRPRVYVTTGLLAALNEHELEAVLWHEEHHLEHRDALKMAVTNALAAAFFFLPLLAALRDRYTLMKELAADQRAVRALGGTRCLAAALYRLLALSAQHDAPLVPIVGVTSALAVRVDALLGEDVAPRLDIPSGKLAWTVAGTGLLALLLVAPLTFFTG